MWYSNVRQHVISSEIAKASVPLLRCLKLSVHPLSFSLFVSISCMLLRLLIHTHNVAMVEMTTLTDPIRHSQRVFVVPVHTGLLYCS
jgi:hypothetical protein